MDETVSESAGASSDDAAAYGHHHHGADAEGEEEEGRERESAWDSGTERPTEDRYLFHLWPVPCVFTLLPIFCFSRP